MNKTLVEVEGCKTWEDLKDGDTLCGLKWWVGPTGNAFFNADSVYPGEGSVERCIATALLQAGNKPKRLPAPEPSDSIEQVIGDLRESKFISLPDLADRLESLGLVD